MDKDKVVLESFKQIQVAKEYWIHKLSESISKTHIFQDGDTSEAKGASYNFSIKDTSYSKITKLTKENNLSIFIFLVTVLKVHLFRITQNDKIVIGTPSYYSSGKIEGINKILLMCDKLNHMSTFKEVLLDVRQTIIDGYKNQNYSLQEAFKAINMDEDKYNYYSINCMMKEIHQENDINNILELDENNVNFIFSRTKDEINVEIKYNAAHYSQATITHFSDTYLYLLGQLVNNMELNLTEVEIVSEKETQKLLYDDNHKSFEYPKDKTIHQLFYDQVIKAPKNIAIEYGEEVLTYEELNNNANRIGNLLTNKGVSREGIVGLLMERTPAMIETILGVLKAGGAYLPLDPALPKERLLAILEDSRPAVIVTTESLYNKYELHLESFNFCIIDKIPTGTEDKNRTLTNINESRDLAYIIYTSGTTGMPKGVMIEHRNVISLLRNKSLDFEFTDKDVWVMFHSYSFDFSVWEMYGALLYGGKLVLISKEEAMNTKRFLTTISNKNVTVLNQTPTSFYNLMNEALSHEVCELALRYIIFGGEKLKVGKLNRWLKKYPQTKLINMYGITETTIHVTYKEISAYDIEQDRSNIGKAISTLNTYIMDSQLKLLPKGIPGELCVSGEGVSRGYLNRKTLTKKKFVRNPYDNSEMIYRSGDLVRFLENGDIEYLGRIDSQVKIRGFRIEIGEIEKCLLKHDDIKHVFVTDFKDKDDIKYLCAYIVAEKELEINGLKDYMHTYLPDYMVPARFIQVDSFSQTINGKIDERLLPSPKEYTGRSKTFEVPSNEIEEKLVEIWRQTLEIKEVSINDDFFYVGGDSIKAIKLISKINSQWEINLQIGEIYDCRTIKELYYVIKEREDNPNTNEHYEEVLHELKDFKEMIMRGENN